MSDPVILRNASDVGVSQGTPNANNVQATKLYLASGGGNQRYAYVFFSRPWPAGATIIAANLRLYNGGTWAGAVTIQVQRITSSFSVNRVTYNNQPSVNATVFSSPTLTGAVQGTEWLIDLKSMIQSVSDGAAWYGFRITATNSTNKWIYSAQGLAQYRPTLEIQWSDNPDAPDVLSPSGGRAVSVAAPTLRFNFTDVSGDVSLAACQVQSNPTNLFTAPEWDSGIQAVSEPQLLYGGPAIADGATKWWRVRVQDGAGLWSDYSDPVSFKRTTKGTLTITNPAASPNNFVQDSTPPIAWTFSGRTMKSQQVIITPQNVTGTYLWTTGKITSSVLTVTPPPKIIKTLNGWYTLILRVWDDQDREATPGDPIYTEQVRDFQFKDGATTAITGLTMTPDPYWPMARLNFSRATAPDTFTILRDDVVVESGLLPGDLFVSGTAYTYLDRTVQGRTNHTWKVQSVTTGVGGVGASTVTGQVIPRSTVLMDKDGLHQVMLLNPDNTAALVQYEEALPRIGNAPPILVRQSIRGYEGHCHGLLADDAPVDVTARTMRDRMKWYRDNAGLKVLLFLVDECIECVVYNVTIEPVARVDTVYYDVEFDFFQTDY